MPTLLPSPRSNQINSLKIWKDPHACNAQLRMIIWWGGYSIVLKDLRQSAIRALRFLAGSHNCIIKENTSLYAQWHAHSEAALSQFEILVKVLQQTDNLLLIDFEIATCISKDAVQMWTSLTWTRRIQGWVLFRAKLPRHAHISLICLLHCSMAA